MSTATALTATGSAEPSVAPRIRKPKKIGVALSFFWLGLIVLLALLADVLPLSGYGTAVGPPRELPQLGSLDLLLGTDSVGRSILSRIIHGARVSLMIGTVATLVAMVIGLVLGMIGGYFGGFIDTVIRLITDTLLAFPPLILLMAIASILQPTPYTLLIALLIIVLPSFIRLSRSATMNWSTRDFIMASRNVGASTSRILMKEILPNLVSSMVAFVPIVMSALIVAEGSLSFLGFGIAPPTPSWGGMIADGKNMLAAAPQLVFIPSFAIFFTVFSLNQLGDHLRTRLDRVG